MSEDTTPDRIWVDGELVSADTAVALASDHGLQMGDGVFDTIAVHDGRPVFLQRHLLRLRSGIERLEITSAPSNDELLAGIHELIEANGLVDARVRVTITPGPGRSPRERGARPLAIISSAPLSPSPTSMRLCLVEWRRNERSPLAGIKSTSWGENAAILRSARARGFDNAILCDSSGRLSECTTSNLFLVIDESILTPSSSTGCLPGIAREVLLEAGVAHEADLTPSDLSRASEIFITSSTTGVVGVDHVDAMAVSANGPLTIEARRVITERSRAE